MNIFFILFFIKSIIYLMEESALMMFIHSVFIGLILFILIFYILQQKYEVAEIWSYLIGSISLIYMIIFGHNLPSANINKNLKF